MRDLKYLLAYLLPLSGFVSVYFGGIHAFTPIVVGFVYIPILEFFLSGSSHNMTTEQETNYAVRPFFDWLLYFNIPLLYSLIAFYLYTICNNATLTTFEIIGMTMSVGVLIGTNGINVAHELGHRASKNEQILSKILLLPALYMHFFIEHNRGHHKNVSTPEDPASAQRNENVYSFWIKSVVGNYRNAWLLEAERLKKINLPTISWENEMLRFQVIQAAYLLIIGFWGGGLAVIAAIIIAIVGFLQLETVNYIEHYGLSRQKMPNGRYEPVLPKHSWNSNHEIGRIVLYELTRHSDHHYKATRKYQVLRHHDESPQLPLGYPGSMVLALVPPLWFRVVHKILDARV